MDTDEMQSDELFRAYAYLMWVAVWPAPGLAALVAEVGAVEAAARVRAGAVSDGVAMNIIAARLTDLGAIAEFDAFISSAIRERHRDGRR